MAASTSSRPSNGVSATISASTGQCVTRLSTAATLSELALLHAPPLERGCSRSLVCCAERLAGVGRSHGREKASIESSPELNTGRNATASTHSNLHTSPAPD